MLRMSALLLVAIPLLAACSNAPEQPSDTPDTPQPDLQIEESDTTIPAIPAPETTASVSSADVIGSWAADTAECTAPGGPPIVITAQHFQSPEESCEIGSLVDNGSGFTANLTCDRGDGTDAALLKLTPDGDSLALSWVGRDEGETVLSRCEVDNR